MKNEKIYSAIGGADDEFLVGLNEKSLKKRYWLRFGAAVACLALVAFFGTRYLHKGRDLPVEVALPMLTISAENAGSFGFEGYYAYDISELVNANPWTVDTQISTLPVFENLLVYDERFDTPGADFDKMKELLLEVADRLGMDTLNLEITDDTPDEETQLKIIEKFASAGTRVPDDYFAPNNVILEGKGIKVQVNKQMSATITFSPTISLPSQYNVSYFSSYEEVYAVAEYLLTSYPDLIHMVNPRINIYGGDYHVFSGEDIDYYGTDHANHYGIAFYDKNGVVADEIINYNFNQIEFYCDEDDNKLYLARIYQPDLSVKVGDYPLITSEEARELLGAGNFITTVPYDFPGAEYVVKVELVYRKGGFEEYFIPYYRFYVELPEIAERIKEMKTYGIYYVPAVQGQYISNMPLWDGRFN